MSQQYLDHSKAILTSDRSNFKGGSKGSGIISLFGYQPTGFSIRIRETNLRQFLQK